MPKVNTGAVILQEIRKSRQRSNKLAEMSHYTEYEESIKLRHEQEKEWKKLKFLQGLSNAYSNRKEGK